MSLPAKTQFVENSPLNLEDYLYMVEAISSNFNREKVGNIRDSEIFSYLSYELVSCLTRFDPAKGSFEKYLSSHLFNKAIDFLRSKKRKKLKCFIVPDDYSVIESICEEEKQSRISTDVLPKLLSKSPKDSDKDLKDRSLLLQHYLGGKTVLELSKRYKITRVSVYNRLKKCINKIRENHTALIEESGGFDML